jgi:hypothetical protein
MMKINIAQRQSDVAHKTIGKERKIRTGRLPHPDSEDRDTW